MSFSGRKTVLLFAVAVALIASATIGGGMLLSEKESESGLPWKAQEFLEEGSGERDAEIQKEGYSQGVANGGSGGEAFEALTAAQQFAEARMAPGIVSGGTYSTVLGALGALPSAGGPWEDVTLLKYDADDTNFRDYYSNSSGGAGGFVTGRITGIAADPNGHVYSAAADGGVWRSSNGGGHWESIADGLPSLSSGDLRLAPDGALWYATGEANTGGTSYVGSGVYRLEHPESGSFTPANRVGGTELESTVVNAVRFAKDGAVWVATSKGVWKHTGADYGTAWTMSYAPNPLALTGSSLSNAPYKNITNDIAIDPKNDRHVIAALGWRSGDTYNGFYETTDAGDTWVKVDPTGAINPKDIGNVTFAFSGKGEKLYAINQSPSLLNKLTGTVNSYLDGIYVSKSGSPSGPWSKIAESHKLANSGSALKQSISGKGYGPGIQSWYNQFLVVDPANPDHVYAGLEEVYETKDGGANWTTPGPYWNFYFSCWRPDSTYDPETGAGSACPLTTHPDQHAAAIGVVGTTPYLFVGNDGGVYRRPVQGAANANGNGTDWKSLNDGTIDALQYYAVGVGNVVSTSDAPDYGGESVIVSGGLQDNGGSIGRPGASKMSSNFGGDGGDVLVDPDNGCNIVQEYVFLSMRVTQSCANPHDPTFQAFLDTTKATTYDIAPPDVNARFIAPFAADGKDIGTWVAGGNSLWVQSNGFSIRSGAEWAKVHTFERGTSTASGVATAVAISGDTIVAGWCGTCNNNNFKRGLVVLTKSGGTWSVAHEVTPYDGGDLSTQAIPNRYVGGVAIDPNDEQHLFVVMNGFSRRFTEGPGAGNDHVFESEDGGATWTSADAGSFPDIPANSVKVLLNGGVVVATDLAVLYRPAGDTAWKRLGAGLPLTVAIDIERGPDNYLYVATHGRGIWRIANPEPTSAAVVTTKTTAAVGSTLVPGTPTTSSQGKGTSATPHGNGGSKGKGQTK